MAIIIGDMIYALAIKMICSSGYDAQKIQVVISHLQSIVQNTIVGQSQDIVIECKKNVTEKEVLNMYENKTARYSFEGPLHLGLIIAEKKELKIFDI
jgi:geranylgeranyl pyrophosphate synthase